MRRNFVADAASVLRAESGCVCLGVVPLPSDVPSPGAATKHNGQPLAEPGEGAVGAMRDYSVRLQRQECCS